MKEFTPKVESNRLEAAKGRKKRIPVNGSERNLLTVENKDQDFSHRWIINNPDRIQKFLDAGYVLVNKDEVSGIGDRKVDTSSGTDSLVTRPAGMGQKLVLVKLPKELKKEDDMAKAKRIDATEEEVRRKPKEQGLSGDINFSRGTV